MRKFIFLLPVSAIMIAAIFTSCNNPVEKVEKAEENVQEANAQLDQAKKDLVKYQAELAAYRERINNQIEANKKIIDDFRIALKVAKAGSNVAVIKQVDEFEQKNNEMAKRLTEYGDGQKEKFESFKTELSHDMDVLSDALKNFSTDNVK